MYQTQFSHRSLKRLRSNRRDVGRQTGSKNRYFTSTGMTQPITFYLDNFGYEGDIILNPSERENMRTGNSYSMERAKWPNASIPYVIHQTIGNYLIILFALS